MATDICSGCTVHQGFWTSWLEARPGILAAVKAAVERNPGYGIVSTGHSLGGAIATLCAANLRNSGYNVALVRATDPPLGSYMLTRSSTPMVLLKLDNSSLQITLPNSQEAIFASPTPMTSFPNCPVSCSDIAISAQSTLSGQATMRQSPPATLQSSRALLGMRGIRAHSLRVQMRMGGISIASRLLLQQDLSSRIEE